MTEDTQVRILIPARATDRRLILAFVFVGAAIILLLLNLAGTEKTFDLIQRAQPLFVLGILTAQSFRYAGSAWSTQTLAKIFGQRVPGWALYQTMLAGQALNRTFSVGGAAGIFVRYSFLTRQGLHSGAFAALVLVEDLLGALTMALVFAAGLTLVILTNALPEQGWFIGAGLAAGFILLGGVSAYVYHERAFVARVVHVLARSVNALMARLIGKSFYDREHIDFAINEFYSGVAHARREPMRLTLAFFFNLLRLGCDAASLYLAFLSIGFVIAPGLLLIIFCTSTVLSTISGVPGELGVMETALAIISTSFGVPPPTAVGAILLFRALSYWLPIPIGYVAFWNLQRRGFI